MDGHEQLPEIGTLGSEPDVILFQWSSHRDRDFLHSPMAHGEFLTRAVSPALWVTKSWATPLSLSVAVTVRSPAVVVMDVSCSRGEESRPAVPAASLG